MIEDPFTFERPVSLLLDTRDGSSSIEQVLTLYRVLGIGVSEKGVCLRVAVLNHKFKSEAIEALGFCSLDLV